MTRWFDIVRMFGRMVGRLPAGHLWYLLKRMANERPHRFDGQVRINSFFPPYPSEAFDRFCKMAIDRRRAPCSTYLAITSTCPFTCDHCSLGHRQSADELTTRQWLEIIERLKSLGGCTVGFTGGEPLARADLPELVASAKPELATVVFTTGWEFTAKMADQLAQAGLDCLTVGIESADAARHDEVRGLADSFAHARKAIELCNAASIYPAISTVGTRERIASGELERMYELAAQWGVREFRLLAPVATGSAAGCDSFMLTPVEREELVDFHIRHNRFGDGPVVASFAYLESAEMFGCGAGYHHMFIDAAGEVCPCDLTPLSFGNAVAEPLEVIWDRMGKHFSHPRCKCVMSEVAGKLSADEPLPIAPDRSADICRPRRKGDPLPGAYCRLLPDEPEDLHSE